jgi:ketosteroid isomerase-like protein
MTSSDLASVIERYHEALDRFFTGDPEPAVALLSRREDVTLANPFGLPARGWKQVATNARRAATHYRDGGATGFESVTKYETPGLAYIVEIERYRARVGGGNEIMPVALRVTSIFRREEGTWKLAHRHADPITTAQTAESVIGK